MNADASPAVRRPTSYESISWVSGSIAVHVPPSPAPARPAAGLGASHRWRGVSLWWCRCRGWRRGGRGGGRRTESGGVPGRADGGCARGGVQIWTGGQGVDYKRYSKILTSTDEFIIVGRVLPRHSSRQRGRNGGTSSALRCSARAGGGTDRPIRPPPNRLPTRRTGLPNYQFRQNGVQCVKGLLRRSGSRQYHFRYRATFGRRTIYHFRRNRRYFVPQPARSTLLMLRAVRPLAPTAGTANQRHNCSPGRRI